MPIRMVTGKVLNLDGSPAAGGVVDFKLLESFAAAEAFYPAGSHSETLDAAGCFSTGLGVPESGTAYYRVTLPAREAREFYLAAGPATDLMTLMGLAGAPVAQNVAQTLIDAHTALEDMLNVMSYGALGDGIADDRAAIQAAIDAAAVKGGTVFLPAGRYRLAASLVLRKGVRVRGAFPGVTCADPAAYDLGWTVSTGSILTYPGGTVFSQDTSGGSGTLSALDGVTVESLGFDSVATILACGATNKSGLCGSVIRDLRGSAVSGVAFDLANISHIHMSNVKVAGAYQFLRVTGDYDSSVVDFQPGNSYFTDLYAYISAAGHGQPSIHLRALSPGGRGTNLAYLHFARVQVNRFLSTSKTGSHLKIEGAGASAKVLVSTFDGCDFEGCADARIAITNAEKIRVIFTGFCFAAANANVDFLARGAQYCAVESVDPRLTVDIDALSTPLFFNGAMQNIAAGGRYPVGLWYELGAEVVRLGAEPSGVKTLANNYQGEWTASEQYFNFTAGGDVRQRVLPIPDDFTADPYLMGMVVLTAAGAQTVTLATAAACRGQRCTFKKTGASGAVTLAAQVGQTIDGAATNTWLSAQYRYITLQSDGANWLVVAKG